MTEKTQAPQELDDASLETTVGGAKKISGSVGKGGKIKPPNIR